ncbi:50S ribosomal protein L32 [Clostridia bacterium]|nr:50S ribosomal protein L32 [Clostridia bacterium]
MAIVPKRKTSKARRNKRRSNVWKLTLPALSNCSKCNELKLAHRVCKFCGFYKGREVLKIDDAQQA